jgi:hypothetical protein
MSSQDLQELELPVLPSFADDCHPIRLLYLELSDDHCAEIRCSTFTVNLLDKPAFKALSYVWGKPTITVPIIVNEQRYHVTPNCNTALRRLREARESPLWIDAICINQKDNAEKATQIPLMGDIYSQAEQVIVWLGYSEAERAPDDEAREKLAFGLLEDLANNNIFSESGDEVYDKFLEIGMSGESPEKRWSAFHDLFSHPWFTRLWVHQEALLATDCVVFTKYDTIQYPSLIISAGVVQTHLFRLARTLEPRPFLMEYELLTELLDKTLKRVQWRAWPTIQKMQEEAGAMNSSNKLVETRSLL